MGVKVSDYSLKNLERQSTKLYDLAGQVDYYGLHQLFMTEGAVYVMTWDASKFLRQMEVTATSVRLLRNSTCRGLSGLCRLGASVFAHSAHILVVPFWGMLVVRIAAHLSAVVRALEVAR